jgi:transposase
LSDDLQDPQLEALLFPPVNRDKQQKRVEPDWAKVATELKRKGVSLQLLWQEYRSDNPDGYCYSQYCHKFGEWKRQAEPRMAQAHKAGDKLFVDYCGDTLSLTNPQTGEITKAQIFVAALGASSYIFAEATETQSLPDWIGSHVRCFTFLNGVPRVVVPDNLKSGVTAPCRYEPDINPTYLKLANHYSVAVVPARVRKPRDKAKVENAVLQVERRILARLRNHIFHSLEEMNAAIRPLLEVLNEEQMKAFGASRKQLYLTLDLPALLPLPEHHFGPGVWSKAKVNVDYHVVVDFHRYSVPYQYIAHSVEVHLTDTVVELFYSNQRIASHKRSNARNGFTTVKEHMPSTHLQAQLKSKEFLIKASRHGVNTVDLIGKVIDDRQIPEQSFRTCMGILRLAETYGSGRLEAACAVALQSNLLSYKSLVSILKNKLDGQVVLDMDGERTPIQHENVRGADYYRKSEETSNA